VSDGVAFTVATGWTLFSFAYSLRRRCSSDLPRLFYATARGAVLKPKKFFAYRKRRPERPPAGRIACHAMRCAQALSGQLSAVSSRAFACPPGLEGSRAESSRRAKTLTSSNTMRCAQAVGSQLSAVSSRAFACPPDLEGSRAESARRAKILRFSNTAVFAPGTSCPMPNASFGSRR
jgi:hypothetical protein